MSQSSEGSSISLTQWFMLHIAMSMVLYVLALSSLSFVVSENWPSVLSFASKNGKRMPKRRIDSPSVARTRLIGVIAATSLLTLPFTCPSKNPIYHPLLRALVFFYACKLLDLCVARASQPPLMLSENKPIPLDSTERRVQYISLLLSECRYHSFDIAVDHPDRNDNPELWSSYGPYLLIPLATYLVPCAETWSLLGLQIIAMVLEAIHTLLHPRCQHPLFWRPFAAGTLSAFWRTHWQQAAAPFLLSLGYRPAKIMFSRLAGDRFGRMMGVLVAFCISGVWHGWAAAALSTTPWRTGLGLWALFIAHGLGCALEQALLKGRQVGLLYSVVVWTAALLAVGCWVRDSLPRSNLTVMVRR